MGRGDRIQVSKETGREGREGREEGREEGGNSTDTRPDNKSGITGQARRESRKETIKSKENTIVPLVVPKPIVVEIEGEDITETKIKPKKSSSRKSAKKETGINANDLSMLISGMFSLVSMKAGDHWQVSTDEANTVAKPLENILRKMDLLEKVSNVSDGAMLVFAVTSITLPRVLMSQQMSKQKKANKIQGGNVNVRAINTGSPVNTTPIEQRSNKENSDNNDRGNEEVESLTRKSSNALYQQPLE